MRQFQFLFVLLLLTSCEISLKEDQNLLANLMKQEPSRFRRFLDRADSLEIQILYTQINRDERNRPTFRSYYFRVDSIRYFYPASTVKLPLVLLSFEKLNDLGIQGLDKFTPVFHDSVYAGQKSVRVDSAESNGLPSIAGYARKILLFSDNNASNRLYEFMGQLAINQRLREGGYNIRIVHRLSRSVTPDQDRHTEAIRFVSNDTLIFAQPMLVNPDSIKPLRKVLKGIGFMWGDSLIRQPFDFSYKNSFPLQEQQEILKAILFPDYVAPGKRFNLSSDDRQFLLQFMSQVPIEGASGKLLMFAGDEKPMPENIRIFSKTGGAYGYLIDNAYVVDFENGVEFLLSAVIHTNRDGIYNDDKYEYETEGYPFLKNLGQLVYRYELQRKRAYKPDLIEFKVKYNR